VLVVECGADHAPERRYILDVVLGEFLGLDYELHPVEGSSEVVITAGSGDAKRLVTADLLFAGNDELVDRAALPALPSAVCPAGLLPGAAVVGEDLPALYARPLRDGRLVDERPDRIELGIDVLGGVFVLLTRLEEAVPGARDAHDRFPTTASLAARSASWSRPLADEYVEALWWALHRLWPGLERRRHDFEVRPTHDVDWPFYSRGRPLETVRQAARDVLTRRDRSLARSRLRSLLAVTRSGRNADPCNTFDFLMDASEQRGLRSAFYFMGGATDLRYDAGYPYDAWLRGVMRDIDRRGHEIGIHPSYRTYRDRDALGAELQTVQRVCEEEGLTAVQGGRQHFLRWENPVTWRNWDAVGLRYDSTLGYPDVCGFRCGTSRAFPVYDLGQRKALGLVERPLIAMEAAVLTHQRESLDTLVDEMHALKVHCRRFGGTFTFLWHNNRLAEPADREAYTSVLD
jgi:hypothetical protein